MRTKSTSKSITQLLASQESTVVAEYEFKPSNATAYQSEAELERLLVETLAGKPGCADGRGYTRLNITTEKELIVNLRAQLERLNNINFSDSEWGRFFKTSIAARGDNVATKTDRIQRHSTLSLRRDDNSTKNIKLIDKKNLYRNQLQVITQYAVDQQQQGSHRNNRYDVTILVNGLPSVHLELKRRGQNIKEAFNQINRYKQDSFWAGSGLYEYIQIFVISNGTFTKYFSNTTRYRHVDQKIKKKTNRGRKQASNSFEFTSWWADARNNKITELIAFAKTFLSKNTLLNILTKYCVFDADNTLLVMRPYQIVATERILQQIETASNHKLLGTRDAGGYVWHTTGSGKTLTSFKTAQLATEIDSVAKVIFVVDRQDLDYQTMKEYDRFAKGTANGNKSTEVLTKQLEDETSKIIVTTIQKLSNFVKRNPSHPIYKKHVVLIFDECHRSQFGQMHRDIESKFRAYNMFGFTGTPIFAETAAKGASPLAKTTDQLFGHRIHTYTIVDAINDKNVLKFLTEFNSSFREKSSIADGDLKISSIDREQALLADERIDKITKYILESFPIKTKRKANYLHRATVQIDSSIVKRNPDNEKTEIRVVSGFNALFATASIKAAKKYYAEFARQQAELPNSQRLKVGLIYSFTPNEDSTDGYLESEIDMENLDVSSRDFLDAAIEDYNEMFQTSFSTNGNGFEDYYRDISMRMKNRELDLCIVVNMFLTGFDATTLNTLYVDKNLKDHGLIQAYSRTNRILNSIKTYGHIVTFRDLEEQTNKALALFGNRDAQSIVIMKPYGEFLDEYSVVVDDLISRWEPGQWVDLESEQVDFVKHFSRFLRLYNVLESFEQFEQDNRLSLYAMQEYQSMYLQLRDELSDPDDTEKIDITDDLVFEIELISQFAVTAEYIIALIEEMRRQKGGITEKQKKDIKREVSSSPSLRPRADLINEFVELFGGSDTGLNFYEFAGQKFRAELQNIIAAENLKIPETYDFVGEAFNEGGVQAFGTAITKILPPVSRFSPGSGHAEKKKRVYDLLTKFVERFQEIVSNTDMCPTSEESKP